MRRKKRASVSVRRPWVGVSVRVNSPEVRDARRLDTLLACLAACLLYQMGAYLWEQQEGPVEAVKDWAADRLLSRLYGAAYFPYKNQDRSESV